MPSILERLFHKDTNIKTGKIEPPKGEQGVNPKTIRKYFHDAGFTDAEVFWLPRIEVMSSRTISLFDQKLILLLARLIPAGKARKEFFGRYPHNYTELETSLVPAQKILDRIRSGEDLDQLTADIRQTLDVASTNSEYHYSDCFDSYLAFVYETIQYQQLYQQVFRGDPGRLGKFFSTLRVFNRDTIIATTGSIKSLNEYPDSESVNRIVAKLTESDLVPENGCIWPARLLQHPAFFPLAERSLESGRSWHVRLQTLWDSFAVIGLPKVTDQEVNTFLLQQYALQRACLDLAELCPEWKGLELSDLFQQLKSALDVDSQTADQPLNRQYQDLTQKYLKAMSGLDQPQRFLLLQSLRQNISSVREIVTQQPAHQKYESKHQAWLQEKVARARRRENPRHPLVSLGIARTIGFEVEYPRPDHIDKIVRRNYYQVMSGLGLKHGGGGCGADEISPGPFYDPETAVTVLKMYSDIGFLDFYLYPNMTCHFNLGIRNMQSFAFLIRNMYLTGAAYNQANSNETNTTSHTSELRILSNDQGLGIYLEGKVFDALTQPALAWDISSAAYLSWAQSAADDVTTTNGNKDLSTESIRAAGLNRYRRELAIIWRKHERAVRQGAKLTGLGKIFHETIPFALNKKLDEQMDIVYPDMPSRYADPATISERKIMVHGSEITVRPTPIDIKGKHWPNIVAYNVDIINQTVALIKEIEFRVEADCVAAINEIEACSDQNRSEELLEDFIRDFAVALPARATPEDKWQAYSEVKALLIAGQQ